MLQLRYPHPPRFSETVISSTVDELHLFSNAYMIERINGISEKSGRSLSMHTPACSRQEPEHKPVDISDPEISKISKF